MESVLSQSGPQFELIVGDDASNDGSQEILHTIKDPRVRLFMYDRNAGLFGNLNRLLNQARGELVRFLCQDDSLEPGCLAEEAAFFARTPAAVMSICQATVVDDEGKALGVWQTGGEPVLYEQAIGLELFLYHGCVAGNLSTVCARRDYLLGLGGFNETFRVSGDYEMWVRLCGKGRLADLQKPLVRLTDHSERLSRSRGAGVQFVRENREIRRRLLPQLPEKLRPYARRYVYLRQNVLDAQELVTCLRLGRIKEARELAGILGPRDLLFGLSLWLLTLNNHLYRPKPVYVNPGEQVSTSRRAV